MNERSEATALFIDGLLADIRGGRKKITKCAIECEHVEGNDGEWKTAMPTGVRTWTIREEPV